MTPQEQHRYYHRLYTLECAVSEMECLDVQGEDAWRTLARDLEALEQRMWKLRCRAVEFAGGTV